MLALARRRILLSALILAALLLVSCGGKDEPQTFGNLLPADTLAWLHLEDLPALEGALESYGLMDMIVEELSKPENREKFEAEMGMTLAEDPRETIHALLQELVRADVSAHAAMHAGATDPVMVIQLECADEAAAGRVMDLMGKHAEGEMEWAGHTAVRIVAEDDMTLFLGRNGSHVVLSSEGERWGETMALLLDPPAAGLVDSEAYQRVACQESGQITAYISPEFQSDMKGLGAAQSGIDPATMQVLMEKYGSAYVHMVADYEMSRLVMREALTTNSPLEPLLVCADGTGELMSWLPAGTFLYEGWLVEDGRPKMELILALIQDTMGAVSEAGAGQMPAMPEDPVATAEGMLGFSLLDLAERVREVAVAGADSPGWLLMMRAHDETQAQEITDMFASIPMLAMLGPGDPIAVGETSMHAYGLPGDPSGKLQLLGRHGDTMVMAFQVTDAAAMEAFLGQVGSGGMMGAMPAHAGRQLKHDGSGWFYLDLGGMLAAFEENVDKVFDDMPPAMAQRLRELHMGAHLTMPDGIVEMVLESGAP